MSPSNPIVEAYAKSAVTSPSRLDLNSFTAQEVHEFLVRLGQVRAELLDDKCGSIEQMNNCIRHSVGLWYSTLFLSSIPVQKDFTIRDRLRRLAEEALQWHEDSFLSHAVVFIRDANRDARVDTIQHYCAVARPSSESISATVRGFLQKLEAYIREHGSTVRTAEHLRWAGRSKPCSTDEKPLCLEEAPVASRFFEEMDAAYFKLTLPLEQHKFGDPEAYLDVIRESFRSSIPSASGQDYHVLQLAGGADTKYAMDDSLGAVAHLYIVFRRRVEPSGVFVQTMRAMLSRMAMCHALEELDAARSEARFQFEQAIRARDEVQAFSSLLRDRARALDMAIQQVEKENDRVRALVAENMWEVLAHWTRKLHALQKPKSPDWPIGHLKLETNHESWPKYYFDAVFLKYLDEELAAAIATPDQATGAWRNLVTTLTSTKIAASARLRAAYRMGLLGENGMRALDNSLLEVFGDDQIDITWLKDVFCRQHNDGHDATYVTSVGRLAFCLGLRVQSCSPKQLVRIAGTDLATMADGLRRLVEALTALMKERTSESYAPFFACSTPVAGGHFASTTFTAFEQTLSIVLSPIQYCPGSGDEQTISLVSESDVVALFRSVKEIISKDYPLGGVEKNGSSFSVLSALGVNESTWPNVRTDVVVSDSSAAFRNASRLCWSSEKKALVFTCQLQKASGGDE